MHILTRLAKLDNTPPVTCSLTTLGKADFRFTFSHRPGSLREGRMGQGVGWKGGGTVCGEEGGHSCWSLVGLAGGKEGSVTMDGQICVQAFFVEGGV